MCILSAGERISGLTPSDAIKYQLFNNQIIFD